jgi:hypothetical protein
MRSLIAFVGFKASGKNTAAEALYPYRFIGLSFADALKDALAAIFCWDRFMLEGITVESRAWRERVDPWWAGKLEIPHFTPRWAMMNVGTEVMRRHFHYDIWVFNVERRIAQVPDDLSVVLVDGRFPNEIALAHRLGGQVICIDRGRPDWFSLAWLANHHASMEVRQHMQVQLAMDGVHPSEYAWIGSRVDRVIKNDGTIYDLHTKVRQLL